MSKKTTLTTMLRKAIADTGNLLQIERDTGLKRAALKRFRDGLQSLRLDLAERLMDYYSIECRHVPRRRKG